MPEPDLQQQIATLSVEVLEKQRALEALKLRVPPEPVADHVLRDEAGEVRLSQLFGERADLIVVHNMGGRCPYCTLWADGFVGLLPHLESRAAFAICSPDAPAAQRALAEARGWPFRMVSSEGSDFTRAMGYEEEREGQRMLTPGFSTFRRLPGGGIERVARDVFGPGDAYCGLWHMFALLSGGDGGWQPRLRFP